MNTERQPVREKTGQTQASGSGVGHDHDPRGTPEGTSCWCSWMHTVLCIQAHVLITTLPLA